MLGPGLGLGFVYLAIVLAWVTPGGNCLSCVDPPPPVLKSDRLSLPDLILRTSDSSCSIKTGCLNVDFCVSNGLPIGTGCQCKPKCSKVLPTDGVTFNNGYCYLKGYCGNCGKQCKVDPTDPTKCACKILDCSSLFNSDYGQKELTDDQCRVADGCNEYKCKLHPVRKFMCTCTKPCSQVHTLFAGSKVTLTTEHCAKYGSCIGLPGPCFLPKGSKECMCANCNSCNPDIACESGCEACPDSKCECGADCTEPLSNCQAGCEGCSYYNDYCNCPQVCKPTPANCQPGCSQCPVYPCNCEHCTGPSYDTCEPDCEFCLGSVCCQPYCTSKPGGCLPECRGCHGYTCGLNQPLNSQNMSNEYHKS